MNLGEVLGEPPPIFMLNNVIQICLFEFKSIPIPFGLCFVGLMLIY